MNLSEFGATLGPGEELFACVPIDGFFASDHNVPVSTCVGFSNQRYIVYAKRGMMSKRYEQVASWSLNDFTPRMNSNEGTALGPFLFMLTLFTNGEETVSAGFKVASQRDEFKELVNQAFENAFG